MHSSESLSIHPATEADRTAIVRLLQEAQLPTQDLPPHLTHFRVAKEGETLLGTVGIEPLGEVALLRSLAVTPSCQGSGLGKNLYGAAWALAKNLHIRALCLITTTAGGFFEKQGFERVDRASVPMAIQETAQFSGVCPSSATVMRKGLPS